MAQTRLQKYGTYEDEVTGTATGITAFAGGGQASATPLTAKYNNITVSGTNGDSVKLPIGLIGKEILVQNSDAAQSINVYPVSGEYINGVLNNPSSILATESKRYVCVYTGYWKAS